MNFILGLILTVAGVLIVMKTEWLMQNFGRVAWFEKNLGAEGGSRLGYKLMGILAIFIGLLLVTGLIGGFMNWLVSPLTRVRQ
jgi:fatty acid desaturase